MGAQDLDVRIRDVLQSVAGGALDARSLSDGDNLYDAGLKSLATLQFLLALEEELGVEFPASMLHQDAFSSLANIRGSVVALTGGRGASWSDRA
jgi:acyl carrier protein